MRRSLRRRGTKLPTSLTFSGLHVLIRLCLKRRINVGYSQYGNAVASGRMWPYQLSYARDEPGLGLDGHRDGPNGRDRCDKRNHQRFPNAKVLIVSKHGDEQLVQEAYNAGACGHVIKENLLAIREVLGTNSEP